LSFEIEDSSGDVYVSAHASEPGEGLVQLARGFVAVVAGSSPEGGAERRGVTVRARDLRGLVVAFVNELVFLFDEEGFLPTGGTLAVEHGAAGAAAQGTLVGVSYDPGRHGRGVEVKAATYHDVRFEAEADGWSLRVLLDL
jgi:SHS2 domain-containing protein